MHENLIQHRRYLVVVAILSLMCLLSFLYKPKRIVNTRSIDKLKIELGGWHLEREIKLDRKTLAFLDPQYYLMRDYRNKEGKTVNLTLVYHKNDRWGAHNPIVCYKSQGWKIGEGVKIFRIRNDEDDLYVDRFIVDKNGGRKIVYYYWFSSNGKITPRRTRQMFDMVLNGLLHGYTESGFVEFSTEVDAFDENRAVARLDSFACMFTSVLRKALK